MGAQVDTGGKKGGLTPNINVTPLVDVVLVLLIIFMVVLPSMSDSGKSIDMVKVARADKPEGELVTVTIDRDEVYSLDDTDLDRPAVIEGLRAAHAKNPRRPILVRADARLPYRVVRELFAEVQDIGLEHVALAVGVSREWSEDEGGG
jgi:biopolymer transport protein TolR